MLNFGAEIPFVSHLGFTLHRMAGGESELHYEARPEHLNSFDVTHGGASMTLLDVTLATAARSDTPEFGVVTIEMKTTFMKPARGRVRCVGKLLQRSASLCFCEGTLYGAADERLAHATGTFKFLTGLPVGGRRIQSPDASD